LTDSISNNDEKIDDLDNIEIFSNTDERLRFLGKILNNDYSRQILLLLIEKEMTANEIANQTKLSLPLVLHHVNQMLKAEMVVVSKTSTNSKNQPMKYYSAKSGIIILPEKAVEKAKSSKSLSRSLKRVMKFASVGFIGITSWFLVKYVYTTINRDENVVEFPFTEDNPINFIGWLSINYEIWIPIVVMSTITLLAYVITSRFKFKRAINNSVNS
jgi:hypothetical protein